MLVDVYFILWHLWTVNIVYDFDIRNGKWQLWRRRRRRRRHTHNMFLGVILSVRLRRKFTHLNVLQLHSNTAFFVDMKRNKRIEERILERSWTCLFLARLSLLFVFYLWFSHFVAFSSHTIARSLSPKLRLWVLIRMLNCLNKWPLEESEWKYKRTNTFLHRNYYDR